MSQLRDEKRNLPASVDAKVVEGVLALGFSDTPSNATGFVAVNATQSFISKTAPARSWSGKIEAGFLDKFAGCLRTNLWLDQENSDEVRLHFYWSCDRQNPYLIRTNVTLKAGKVADWTAEEFHLVPILNGAQG
jgi:hypothetical protein